MLRLKLLKTTLTLRSICQEFNVTIVNGIYAESCTPDDFYETCIYITIFYSLSEY